MIAHKAVLKLKSRGQDMKLAKLLERLEYEIIQGTKDIEISKVVDHSKDAAEQALFVCISGMRVDGAAFIEEAVAQGAVAVVLEQKTEVPKGITVIRVNNARKALAKLGAAFYGNPARELKVIGITGTKGKTTTAMMMYEILIEAGYPTGLIGTIEVRTGKRCIPASCTSPESLATQQYLREMADSGCRIVIMEVSSQALKLHRTDEIPFAVGVFTNLGFDHIGTYEHADHAEYKRCKARLFRQCTYGLLNQDDPSWEEMLAGSSCQAETFGFSEQADHQISEEAYIREADGFGTTCRIDGEPVRLAMPGRFNLYNAAAAYLVCRRLGVPHTQIQKTLSHLQVRGRVEWVKTDDPQPFLLMIDYAHNAMSLQSVLEMLHFYNPKKIITIFGCGGGRAKERRYAMGNVSGRLSDLTIVTSDNPRYEDPRKIIEDICEGIEQTGGTYVAICDRNEAVRYAIEHAQPEDVILLAGKGHETYQEICGKKYHMDDREIVLEALREREEGRTEK